MNHSVKFFIPLIGGFLMLVGAGGPFLRSEQGESTDSLRARGRSLYVSLCERCHGSDGSETSYPNIVPVDGIDRRLDEEEVASLSAPFVGRTFEGAEAQALFLYLSSLGGAKDLEEPGWLLSPYFLNKKHRHAGEYRLIDVRSREEYEKGHIPGAVHWGRLSSADRCLVSREVLVETLERSGISEEIFTVIYDDSGGPEAACLWWNLTRHGYKRVAILDGGWKAWTNNGHPQTDAGRVYDPAHSIPSLSDPQPIPVLEENLSLLILDDASPGKGIRFDWQQVMAEDGLKHGSELRQYLERIGLKMPGSYRVRGSEKNLSLLVFVSYLLGYEASFNRSEKVISIR